VHHFIVIKKNYNPRYTKRLKHTHTVEKIKKASEPDGRDFGIIRLGI
jgi:hypothetical protein